jgi:energy-coupling factor transporter transmembrane protein EcfT
MGGSLILLLFIGAFIFSMIRSKAKLKTVIYVFASMLLALLVMVIVGWFVKLNGYAVGEASVDVCLLIGTLTALIHSRRNAASQASNTEVQG